MHLDRQHPTPIYMQLKELLRGQIEQGIYLSHQKLPSERDLCQHHDLSRMTARRALQELISEGWAYTKAGKGTFVSQNAKGAESSSRAQASHAKQSGSSPPNIFEPGCKQKLITPLLGFDGVGVEQAIGSILARHPLEAVAGTLFLEVINYSEQQWLNEKVDLSAHNYAITTIRLQLVSMMNAAAMSETGPKILLACAPNDQHEIGLLLLALCLRRRGFKVIYLGPGVEIDRFHRVVELAQPKVICMSAATQSSFKGLMQIARQYKNILTTSFTKTGAQSYLPNFTFGGVIFKQNPALISDVSGSYLGNKVEDAVKKIQHITRKL